MSKVLDLLLLRQMKKHDHHILSLSPWPVLLSICAVVLSIGVVGIIHNTFFGYIVAPIGLLSVVFVLYRWWRDVVTEAILEKCFTEVVKQGLRIGLAVMILSESMFFFAFFWSFFKAWLFPSYTLVDFSQKVTNVWPPLGIAKVDPWSIPFLNTVTLLLSGCTITSSHHYLLEGDLKASQRMLLFTIALGIIFSVFQFIEYHHAGFAFAEEGVKAIYSSNFYMSTGFHGLHVIVGIVFLIVCSVRIHKGQITQECHIGFDSAAWYWHFVDVVWLFLFLFLYVVSS